MTTLSELVDMPLMQKTDRLLASIGIPAVCVPTVEKYDFDPEPLLELAESVSGIVSEVRNAAGALAEPLGGDDCWEGQARDQAEEYRQCVASWWQEILDFLLGIVDWLVQLIDYILEALNWICSWLFWLAGAIAAIIAAVVWIAGALAVALPEAVAAVGVALGGIAAVAFIVGILTWILKKLFEWLLDLISQGRDSLCGGDVIPRTDPYRWNPLPSTPTWPFS